MSPGTQPLIVSTSTGMAAIAVWSARKGRSAVTVRRATAGALGDESCDSALDWVSYDFDADLLP